MSKLKPIHPGEILRKEYLEPLNMSLRELTRHMDISISFRYVLLGQQSITEHSAMKLARVFDTTAEFWMQLQINYDLAVEANKS